MLLTRIRGQLAWIRERLPSTSDVAWQGTPMILRRRILRRCVDDVRARILSNAAASVCFPPDIGWHCTAFQRDHQMALALSELGCHVFFHEPTEHGAYDLPKASGRDSRPRIESVSENLHLVRCPTFAYRDIIRFAQPDAMIMVWPRHAAAIPEETKTCVIYDMCDDHSLLSKAGKTFRRTHEKWMNAADIVVTTADSLQENVRLRRADALLLPNAVRLEDWTLEGPAAIPDDMVEARKAKVVVGYYGAIARWFDAAMWEEAARSRPDWAFVLLGAAYDVQGQAFLDRIQSVSNIHYLGAKQYAELKGYLASWDVATIPFVLNSITQACSPVKLFEYMAAGKPVVATAMRECLKYKSVIVAQDATDFVQKIELALSRRDDSQYQQMLRSEAADNTWRARARILLDTLEEVRRQQQGVPRRHLLRHSAKQG